MGRIVIACYRPKEGQEAALRALVREHLPVLRSQNLVTDRPATVMASEDGTIIEIFEWVSPAAIESAHTNPQVGALWERFSHVCEWIPVASVPEASQMFSEFSPIE